MSKTFIKIDPGILIVFNNSYLFSQTTTNKTTQPIKTENALLPHKSTTPQPTVPTAITFNWKKRKDIPEKIIVIGQPVAIQGKLYMKGRSNDSNLTTVLVYTPNQDSWDELPPPPVKHFTIATLIGRLLVVGGWNNENKDTILTFDEISQQWVQSLPRMPKPLIVPKVVVYQKCIIVIGVCDSKGTIADVNVLDTTSNKWITAEPLPSTNNYEICLIAWRHIVSCRSIH